MASRPKCQKHLASTTGSLHSWWQAASDGNPAKQCASCSLFNFLFIPRKASTTSLPPSAHSSSSSSSSSRDMPKITARNKHMHRHHRGPTDRPTEGLELVTTNTQSYSPSQSLIAWWLATSTLWDLGPVQKSDSPKRPKDVISFSFGTGAGDHRTSGGGCLGVLGGVELLPILNTTAQEPTQTDSPPRHGTKSGHKGAHKYGHATAPWPFVFRRHSAKRPPLQQRTAHHEPTCCYPQPPAPGAGPTIHREQAVQ